MNDPAVSYKIIEGHPDYAVGNDGSVWSKRVTGKWKRMAGSIKDHGYRAVKLHAPDGVQTERYVHALVLEAFEGPCPEGMQVCHFPDKCRTNNAITNIRWGSVQDNADDRVIHAAQDSGRSQLLSAYNMDVRAMPDTLGIKGLVEFGVDEATIGAALECLKDLKLV